MRMRMRMYHVVTRRCCAMSCHVFLSPVSAILTTHFPCALSIQQLIARAQGLVCETEREKIMAG